MYLYEQTYYPALANLNSAYEKRHLSYLFLVIYLK
ncbi:hypothetical protein YPPY54_1007, partial [Yersinia pestis PY-54]